MIDVLPLALLMGVVTYPSRAIPLLVFQLGRIPRPVLAYLRLVGPAVLAALAATNVMVIVQTDSQGARTPTFHVGIEWLAVLACVVIVAWRKNLLFGIVIATVIVAVARTVELA
jgi:branched-subunit amino acid transport protein